MQSLQPRGVHGQPQYVQQVFNFPDGKAPDSAGAEQFWTPAADDDWTQLTHAMAAKVTWKAKRIGASLHQEMRMNVSTGGDATGFGTDKAGAQLWTPIGGM